MGFCHHKLRRLQKAMKLFTKSRDSAVRAKDKELGKLISLK